MATIDDDALLVDENTPPAEGGGDDASAAEEAFDPRRRHRQLRRGMTSQQPGEGSEGFLGRRQAELFGQRVRSGPSGAFQDVDVIGKGFSNLLQERLFTPTRRSEAFQQGSTAIRDALSAQSATARQRLGDTAQAGGFLGSGAAQQGSLDIARGESMAFSQGIQELFLQLEDRRERNVLPFLSAASGETLSVDQLNIQSRGQDMDFAADIFGSLAGI